MKIDFEKLKKMPPLERIKFLKKLGDEKKKALEEIAKKTETEMKTAEKLINKSFEDIKIEEEIKLKDEEKRILESLEDAVKEAKIEEKERKTPQELYNSIIKPIHEGNLKNILEGNLYKNLVNARNNAANGNLANDDLTALNNITSEFEKTVEDETYIRQKDPKNYVERSRELLNQLTSYASSQERMSDYKITKEGNE